MKAKMLNKGMMMALVMSLSMVSLFAQPRRGMGQGNAPQGWKQGACMQQLNLTEEQEEKISTLRTEQQKSMLQYRNQLAEKQARLRTLQTADTPDMKAINSTIEEMGDIRTEMMKRRAAHRQDVRSLLTEDQRVIFDSQKGQRMGKGFGRGQGHGRGAGYGQCMGYFGSAM